MNLRDEYTDHDKDPINRTDGSGSALEYGGTKKPGQSMRTQEKRREAAMRNTARPKMGTAKAERGVIGNSGRSVEENEMAYFDGVPHGHRWGNAYAEANRGLQCSQQRLHSWLKGEVPILPSLLPRHGH